MHSNTRRMRLVTIFVFIVSAGLIVAHATAAAPQRRKGSGVLGGLVLGPDDKPVAKASVTYQSSSGNAPHAVYTDASGHFAIQKLPADNYDLRASGNGVFSEWAKNVNVHSGQTTSVTLRLVYARQIPKAYTKSRTKH